MKVIPLPNPLNFFSQATTPTISQFMENHSYGVSSTAKKASPKVDRHGAPPLKIGNYILGETLGLGSFGKVKLAEHEMTGHKVAVKILNRKKISNLRMDEKIRREIHILKLFRHPHIIKLYEVIETSTDIFMIMEYVSGGELFEFILSNGRLSEDVARRFFQQIISGVEYCHGHMVVHRDLKPENLLLDSSHQNVKIADFGLSNIMKDGDFLKTSCGSPNYAAPEVISGQLYAGPEVDVWSCGVILYALLCAKLPFDDDYIPNLFKKIKGGIYTIPSYVSPTSKDLIEKMLLVDPLKRITVPEIRQHAFFQTNLPTYLAVPSAEVSTQAITNVNDSVLAELVRKLGVDRETIIRELQTQSQSEEVNRFIVAYHLVEDHQRDYAQEAKTHPSTLGQTPSISSSFSVSRRASLIDEEKINKVRKALFQKTNNQWALGIATVRSAAEIMKNVYKILQKAGFKWKAITSYNLRCFNHQTKIKLTVQLFKVKDSSYLLDVKYLDGEIYPFFDECATLMQDLREIVSSPGSSPSSPHMMQFM